MPKHAGQSRPSDTQIADQARACANELRRMFTDPMAGSGERVNRSELIRWAGRALALLEIMAGDTK